MLLLPWLPYFFVLFCMANTNADEETAATVTLAWAVGGAIYQRVRAARKRVHVIRDFRNIVSGAGSAASPVRSLFRPGLPPLHRERLPAKCLEGTSPRVTSSG
jgi:hypothetical protein